MIETKKLYAAAQISQEGAYREKKIDQIPHDIVVKNFLNFEKIIEKFL